MNKLKIVLIFILALSVVSSTIAKEQTTLKAEIQDKNFENYLSKNKTLVLDLETVLQMALDKNLQIQIQDYSVQTARDRLVGSTAEFLPSISLSQVLLQRDGHIQIFGNQVIRVRQKSIQPRMQATFNLFEGGRVLFGWIASRNQLAAQKALLSDTQQEVLSNAANTYFSLQRFAAELESEITRLKQAEQNLKERQTALELGDDIRLSVLLADQEVQESRARISTLRGQFYTQSSNLNAQLNLPIDVLILPVGNVDESEIVRWQQNPSLEGLISNALNNRPDLQALKSNIKAQRALQTQSISQFLPSVQLGTQLGLIGPRYNTLYGDEQLFLTVQYDALRNLGGAAVSNYLQNKHIRQRLETEYDLNLKNLESRLANLYLAVITSRETLNANRAALNAAEESYRQARIRLKEGFGTPYEITVSQTGLERARANYFDAAINNKVAQVNLLRGLGMANTKNLVEGVEL